MAFRYAYEGSSSNGRVGVLSNSSYLLALDKVLEVPIRYAEENVPVWMRTFNMVELSGNDRTIRVVVLWVELEYLERVVACFRKVFLPDGFASGLQPSFHNCRHLVGRQNALVERNAKTLGYSYSIQKIMDFRLM